MNEVYTYEVFPVNYANIEIKTIDKINFESMLKKLSIEKYGMYGIKYLNSDNKKTKFQIEFPIWEKKKIVIENLENFKSFFEESGIFMILKIGNPQLKSKGVYPDDLKYPKMDEKIIKENSWAKNLFK